MGKPLTFVQRTGPLGRDSTEPQESTRLSARTFFTLACFISQSSTVSAEPYQLLYLLVRVTEHKMLIQV
jgi:hypothetical protein